MANLASQVTDSGWGENANIGGVHFLPKIIASLRRSGSTLDISSAITHLTYTESDENLDEMLLTLFDPYMALINNPMMVNDGGTDLHITFGYTAYKGRSAMFPSLVLTIDKIEPNFGENGIEINLEALNAGAALAGFTSVDVWTRPEKFTASDIVKKIAQLNGLAAVVEPTKELKLVWTQGSMSDFAFVHELAKTAVAKNPAKKGAYRVYVENGTLYFRPTDFGQPVSHSYTFYEGRNGEVISFQPSVSKLEVVGKTAGGTVKIGNNIYEGVFHGYYGDAGTIIRPTAGGRYWYFVDKQNRVSFFDPISYKPVTSSVDQLAAVWFKTQNDTPVIITTAQGDTKTISSSFIDLYNTRGLDDFLKVSRPEEFEVYDAYARAQQSVKKANKEGTGATSISPTTASSVEQAQAEVDSEYVDEETKTSEAELVVLGNPLVKAKQTIQINGVSNMFSGKWYAHEVEHTIGESGYITTIKLQRSAVNSPTDTDVGTPDAVISSVAYYHGSETTAIYEEGSDTEKSETVLWLEKANVGGQYNKRIEDINKIIAKQE